MPNAQANLAGVSVDEHLSEVCDEHKTGGPEVRGRKAQESLEMMLRIGSIMNLRQDRRLETRSSACSWAWSPQGSRLRR